MKKYGIEFNSFNISKAGIWNGKSWWINLSSSLFEKMFLMKGEIHKWMQTGEEKECLKIRAVVVKVKEYEGEYYFCFEKKEWGICEQN